MRRSRGVAVLLVALAVLGAVWLATSWSLAMLGSASMEPWAAPGDLLVHRVVPAARVEVGDVITVSAPGRGLVTHRVVELTDADGQRTVVLKGDRSRIPDPDPVVLPAEVDRVVTVVPQLGSALRIGGPWLVAAAVLVVLGAVVLAVGRSRTDDEVSAAVPQPPSTDPRLEALLATCDALGDDGLSGAVLADVVRVRTAAIVGLPAAERSGAVLALDDGSRFYVLAVADVDPDMLRLVPDDSRRRHEASEAVDQWWAAVADGLDAHTAAAIEPWTTG